MQLRLTTSAADVDFHAGLRSLFRLKEQYTNVDSKQFHC